MPSLATCRCSEKDIYIYIYIYILESTEFNQRNKKTQSSGVVVIEKGIFGSPSTMVAKFTYFIQSI